MKKYYLIFIIIIIWNIKMQANDFSLIPNKIDGWSNSNEDKIYDKKTIYDYLDGGAELYIAYNMELLYSRRFKKKGETDIVIDMFKMGSSKDAFGLFSHDYEGNELNIGNGSVYEAGLIIFWKANYYISILAEKETPSSKQAILNLANIIAKNINDTSLIPPIINKIDTKEFKLISKHYFQTYICLNFYYYLSDKNILNLSHDTEGVIAKYDIDNKINYLIIIQYKDDYESREALVNYGKEFLKTNVRTTSVVLKNKKWYGIKQNGKYLILTLDSQSKDVALKLLGTIKN